MAEKAGTKGVPRHEREESILDAAAGEIGRVGYAGLFLGSVATAAGVSKPLIYAYFDSKDGVYVRCVRRAAANLCDAMDRVIGETEEQARAGTVTTALAGRTLAAIFGALEHRPYDWRVVFDRSHPEQGPAADAAREARRQIAERANWGISAFGAAGGLTDSDDVSALTAAWMGIVSALVDWWLRHPGETAAQMTARSLRLVALLD
ncbi:TetR/AcrR family transcriptional regulator [Nocardia sp. NPDC005978]|uniref:TetR/AcrR family transcriptional regulator n=1 Tax=Nocardia sp. NPDC005978 TaxID=3156725 RepID=UPI0033A814CB